jgi:hypothetical protein
VAKRSDRYPSPPREPQVGVTVVFDERSEHSRTASSLGQVDLPRAADRERRKWVRDESVDRGCRRHGLHAANTGHTVR